MSELTHVKLYSCKDTVFELVNSVAVFDDDVDCSDSYAALRRAEQFDKEFADLVDKLHAAEETIAAVRDFANDWRNMPGAVGLEAGKRLLTILDKKEG